ncbi:hypothetical protein CTAYLR_010793 [Chrysophaeum taylorii]|uniref:Uncharacterized protein n=1 Tax=Chrysophaeum taylorii TaxID=2483200 RepID=A0AAD7UIS2_9STRA|nr:hypothetical protein CTAYLR_010793 [Chrysophaeum taylorii]
MTAIERTKEKMKAAIEQTDPKREEVERVDALVDSGLDIITTISTIGTAIPLISGACGMARLIFLDVRKYKDKADDVVQAGRRVLDVLEFLRLLAHIAQLLEEFKTAVEKFGEPGFFKRFWKLRKYAGTLSRLDGEIRDKLDFLTNALEEALEKYVDERLDKDERALEDVAKEGGVDPEETTTALVFEVIAKTFSLDVYEKGLVLPLLVESFADDTKTIEALLEKTPHIIHEKLSDVGGACWALSALHVSAMRGNLNAIRRLKNMNGDFTIADARQRSPLHRAAAHGHVNVVWHLLVRCGVMSTPWTAATGHP